MAKTPKYALKISNPQPYQGDKGQPKMRCLLYAETPDGQRYSVDILKAEPFTTSKKSQQFVWYSHITGGWNRGVPVFEKPELILKHDMVKDAVKKQVDYHSGLAGAFSPITDSVASQYGLAITSKTDDLPSDGDTETDTGEETDESAEMGLD